MLVMTKTSIRPWTPAFKVTVDGKEIDSSRTMEIMVADLAGNMQDHFEWRLANRGDAIKIPSTGAEVNVYLGYKETGGPQWFDIYRVDEPHVAGPVRTLTIRGQSVRNTDGPEKVPRTQSWKKAPLKTIVETIATRNGYKPMVGEFNLVFTHIDQTNESDYAFLNRLATVYDCVSKIKGNTWIFKKHSEKLAALPPIVKTLTDLTGWSAVPNVDRNRFRGVCCFWHDLENAERKKVTIGAPPFFEVRHLQTTEEMAHARATAMYERLFRFTGIASLNLYGDPAVMAEQEMTITNVGQGVDGTWQVNQVFHTINADEFSTQVRAVRPPKAAG